jgi:hypothetical protein
MGTELLPSTLYAKIQGQHQWKNFRILQCHRLNHLWFGHNIHPVILISCTSTYQMTLKHSLPSGCWVYDVVNSTMFWDPTIGRGISPSEIVQLDKASSLSTSTQRVEEDRVDACSIWSPKKGANNLQKCRKKINGRTSTIYDVVDSTTSNLDNKPIQSPIVHAFICIK